MNIEIEHPPLIKVGDLCRLSTPDGDDGKLLLITGITAKDRRTSYPTGVIVGESEEHAYLQWELQRVEKT